MAKRRQDDLQLLKPLGLKEGHSVIAQPDGSMFDCKNVYLDPFGRRKKRRGAVSYFNAGAKIENIFDYTTTAGTQRIMVRCGTVLSYKDGTGIHTPELKTGLTASARMSMVKYYDRCYMASASDGFWKYDSGASVFDRVRLSPPTSTPSLSQLAGTSGFVAGQVYKYYVTFYNSTTGWESNPYSFKVNAPSITIAVNTNKVRVTVVAKGANESADKYRIYRTSANGTTLLRIAEPAYAATLATGYYEDNGDADGTVEIEDDNNVPVDDSPVVAVYMDRVVLIDGDKIVYSKNTGRSYAFPVANYHTIGGDGKDVLNVIIHGDMIIAAKSTGLWFAVGDLGDSGTVFHALTVPGIVTAESIASYSGAVMAFTQNSFFLGTPTDYDVNDIRFIPFSQDIKKKAASINKAAAVIPTVRSIGYGMDEFQHIYFFMPWTGETQARWGFVYDVTKQQWVFYEVDFPVSALAMVIIDGTQRLIIGDENGYAWKFDETDCYTDGSSKASNFLNGTVTSSTVSTLVDSSKVGALAWTTDEFKGCYVHTITGTGAGQRRLITANTNTGQLSITPNWTDALGTDTTYSIGCIDAYNHEAWICQKTPNVKKRLRWIRPFMDQDSTGDVKIDVCRAFSIDQLGSQKEVELTAGETWSPGGTLIWDTGLWSGGAVKDPRLRFKGKYRFMSVKFSNAVAGEYYGVEGYEPDYQLLTDRVE